MTASEELRGLTARGVATRTRIIEAAADLVHRHGAAATSLDAVLAVTKVSKSQLYHYFADKDALILAVIERQTERVLAGNEPLLVALHNMAGLRHWRDQILGAKERTLAAGGCPLGSLVGELAEQPRPRAALAAGFARWKSYFVDGFRRMRASGELRENADPEQLATAVIAGLQGGLLLAQTERSIVPLKIALDMAVAHVDSYSARRT